jgi:hypothetical protein
MISQILAVTSINLRSIPQRWGMSLATIFSIALVVGVLLGFLAMANGFRATVSGTGSEQIAVSAAVWRSGGTQFRLWPGYGAPDRNRTRRCAGCRWERHPVGRAVCHHRRDQTLDRQ